MSRFPSLIPVWIAVVVSGVLWSQPLQAKSSPPSRPNFIVIYSDDHGWADLASQGVHRDLRTPNLDALAAGGVRATHGYVTAPQCVPSRGGLLTGRFQGRFGLDNNGSSLSGFDQQTTIASRLQRVGYATAHFGKWHLGPTEEVTQHGFHHSFSQNAQRPFTSNITLDGQDRPMSELKATEYHVDACSEAAAAIIRRYRERPFFLYIAYRAPHTPLDAPAKYTSRFPGSMPERRRQALAMISAIDDGIGTLLQTLRECGLEERTAIFFMGDNGAPLKIHKVDSPLDGDAGGWDGSLNEPMNGEKGMLSEGGIRVPWLAAWKGTIPNGLVYSQPVISLDVAATIAANAHLDVPDGELDGVNLVPYFQGKMTKPPHEKLMWRWTAQSAIRAGKWKLIRGGHREYLFDLETDPGERSNQAQAFPQIAEQLRSELTSWCDELNPPGLALGPMASVWNDYFDHYFDGKTINRPPSPQPDAEPLVMGWIGRNARLSQVDGMLSVSPIKSSKGKGLFIACSKLLMPGPVKIELDVQSDVEGTATIAWRSDMEGDFLPANRIDFEITSSSNWETHSLSLPTQNRIIHLRLHLPSGKSQIRRIDAEWGGHPPRSLLKAERLP